MNTTSSPPFTVSAALLFAFTFQAAVSFILSIPAGVKLDRSLLALLSILSFTACAKPTFTWSPLAAVTISSVVPTTLNWSPPVFDSTCSFVTDELSPPSFILLSLTSFNCDTFTASLSFTPAATLVIVLFPALIPSLVTDIGVTPVPDGVTVKPFPFITVFSPAAVLNSADVKPVNSFASFTFIFPVLSTIAPILLSDSLVLSDTPPSIFNVSFNFLEIVLFGLVATSSPLNFNPSAIVATW